ncbi:hypothetical protein KY289_030533 [Solanum tuberosum]|nr:hypothetical protein KY289_030533 [Solanum tuberosum]
MDNVRNKSNKDMDINQQQPKGYKDSGPNDDNTNLYNQQKDQGQKQGQQEDQWHTQRRRNNNQQQVTRGNTIQPNQSTKQAGIMAIPTQNTYINLDVHESPPPLEELAIHKGSKQDSRLQPALKHQQEQGEQITNVTKNIAGKEVSKGQDVTGIDSMLPPLKPLETIVVEDAVGGRGVQKEGDLTHARHNEVESDHSRDSRAPATPLRNQQNLGTQEIIDTGQQHSRFNNKSGERLSKKRTEAIKKRMQKNTGQDPDVTNTGTLIKDQALSKDQQGKLLPDDYGELNSKDEEDSDNQSMDESEEEADDTMKKTGPVFGSNIQDKCSDV